LQQRIIESRLKAIVPATSSSSSITPPLVAAHGDTDASAAQAGLKDKTAQRRLRRGRK
jgi:hypothetical protein